MPIAEELSAAFGFLHKDEVPELKRLARLLPDNPVVVNLGAGTGNSGVAFLESRLDLFLITVDKTLDIDPRGGLGNEAYWIEKAGIAKDRYRHIHGDTAKTGWAWDGDPVQAVFVDADHSYEGCLADIDAWLPHIKDGGIMAFHDYSSEVWPAVARAVDERMAGFEQVGYVDTVIAFRIDR
jgi:predicted O-methyltransferase YrrM